MYFVYVLYSREYDRIYIGYSTDITSRIKSHNDPRNRGWTTKFKPWILLYSELIPSKKEALFREKQLKSFKGREFIKSLLSALNCKDHGSKLSSK